MPKILENGPFINRDGEVVELRLIQSLDEVEAAQKQVITPRKWIHFSLNNVPADKRKLGFLRTCDKVMSLIEEDGVDADAPIEMEDADWKEIWPYLQDGIAQQFHNSAGRIVDDIEARIKLKDDEQREAAEKKKAKAKAK